MTASLIHPAKRPVRLAYLVSHPIHYQVPFLRLVADDPDIELTVLFQSDLSLRPVLDPGFGTEITWNMDLISGYRHEFLPAIGSTDRLGFVRPWTCGLWRRLYTGGFDALWVHGYYPLHNQMAIIIGRALGMRVLVRDDVTPISKPRGPIRRLLKRLFFRGLGAVCHGFTTVGTLNAAYYRENGIPDHQMFLMPYAVDNDRFRTAAAAVRTRQPSLRRQLGLEDGAPIILYASKLQKCKHADILLAAYAEIANEPGLSLPYLIIVGEGELRGLLETEIARLKLDRVRMLGFKGQDELPAYYAMADVFVLPSSRESWGLVVNEAMNCGPALIVTDMVGCAPDLVQDGVNGVIVKAKDVNDMARALRRLLADPEKTRAMGQTSIEIIRDWNFAADLRGLRQALGLPVFQPPEHRSDKAPSR